MLKLPTVCEQFQTEFFLRKIPVCLLIKQVSWLTARRALHLLTAHCLHGNGICSLLPVYSDRIAREFHPIPFYPNRSWALDRLFHCLMSDLFYCKSLFLSIPVS